MARHCEQDVLVKRAAKEPQLWSFPFRGAANQAKEVPINTYWIAMRDEPLKNKHTT